MSRQDKLPTDWERVKLRKLVAIDNESLGAKTPLDYEFLYASLSDVNSGVISKDLPLIKFSDAPSRARRKVKKGDVLFSTVRPNLEGYARINGQVNNLIASTGFAVLSPKEITDTDFIYQYLYSCDIKRQIYALVVGSNYPAVNSSDVTNLKFFIPKSTSERQAIAELLSTWDETIEKIERLIQAKEKRVNALCQAYFRENSEISKNWELVKIGKFVMPRNERAVPTAEQPLYSLTIENGVTEKTERYNREFLVKDKGIKTYKVVHPGDIVFNPANLRWGAIARSTVDHKVVLSPIYEVLQIKKDVIDPVFLTHVLTCPRQVAIYASKTEGTLIERMAVKLDAFLLLKIRVPSSISEQKEIAETLSSAQNQIDLLKQLAEKYKIQKRGLMQKMLTGEWRVKLEIVKKYEEV